MRKTIPVAIMLLVACSTHAQKDDVINLKEVQRIENTLASDQMQGRKAGTPAIDKAAAFIADEFKRAGLTPLKGNSFLQPFSMISAKLVSMKTELNENNIDPANVVVITTKADLKVNEKSGYSIEHINAGESFGTKARGFVRSGKNAVVFVDTSF